MNLTDARVAMIEVGRRMWQMGFTAANDGNLSIRLEPDRVLTTATGSIKGFLREDDLVVVDGSGRLVEGSRDPSSELLMHLAVYEERPDVEAVAHAHPPTATGFATAGEPLDTCVLPEIVATLGHVPTVPYGTPGTAELADALRPYVREGSACLLANHGAVAWDRDLFAAYYHLERLEHFAKILLTARLLGREQVLSGEQVQRLYEATGQAGRSPSCLPRERAGAATPPVPEPPVSRREATNDEWIERITREVKRVLSQGR